MSTVEYGFPMVGGLMPVSKINESITNMEFLCEKEIKKSHWVTIL